MNSEHNATRSDCHCVLGDRDIFECMEICIRQHAEHVVVVDVVAATTTTLLHVYVRQPFSAFNLFYVQYFAGGVCLLLFGVYLIARLDYLRNFFCFQLIFSFYRRRRRVYPRPDKAKYSVFLLPIANASPAINRCKTKAFCFPTCNSFINHLQSGRPISNIESVDWKIGTRGNAIGYFWTKITEEKKNIGTNTHKNSKIVFNFFILENSSVRNYKTPNAYFTCTWQLKIKWSAPSFDASVS